MEDLMLSHMFTVIRSASVLYMGMELIQCSSINDHSCFCSSEVLNSPNVIARNASFLVQPQRGCVWLTEASIHQAPRSESENAWPQIEIQSINANKAATEGTVPEAAGSGYGYGRYGRITLGTWAACCKYIVMRANVKYVGYFGTISI